MRVLVSQRDGGLIINLLLAKKKMGLCKFCGMSWMLEFIINQSFGLLVGIVAGLATSWWYARQTKNIETKRENILYSQLAGKFFREIGGEKLAASAVISHDYRNKLTIEVNTFINKKSGEEYSTDQIHIWTGEITMDSVRNGTIVWEYQKPEKKVGENGFKRIIVSKDLSVVTLVGEVKPFGRGLIGGHATEKFVKKIASS